MICPSCVVVVLVVFEVFVILLLQVTFYCSILQIEHLPYPTQAVGDDTSGQSLEDAQVNYYKRKIAKIIHVKIFHNTKWYHGI